MTHIGGACELLPLPALGVEEGSDLVVKVYAHGANLAKFCAASKQPFALLHPHSRAMEKPSVNQVVAENLAAAMRRAKISEKALGAKAGVSARTVGNFLRPEGRTDGTSGKAASGKLTELAMIAEALDVSVVSLVKHPGLDVNDPRLYMSATLTAQWLAAFLSEIPEGKADEAVERLKMLVKAPDSQRAIGGVAALLSAAHASKLAAPPEDLPRKQTGTGG